MAAGAQPSHRLDGGKAELGFASFRRTPKMSHNAPTYAIWAKIDPMASYREIEHRSFLLDSKLKYGFLITKGGENEY